MTIKYAFNDEEDILKVINTIFGIHSYHIAYVMKSNLEIIKEKLIKSIELETFKTFKVRVKRSDKTFPKTSMELANYFGGVVLKNKNNIKVDVNNPDTIINIEIRKENTYIYYNAYKGLGGYPNGIQGKGLLMLSGGIDSPVAGYLALKRGIDVECIYFDSPPHTSENAKNKVISLASKLNEYSGNVKMHVVPFTKMQEEMR